MKITTTLLFVVISVFIYNHVSLDVNALSLSSSSSLKASRQRLREALVSPSKKKVTLSPEIFLVEPTDPTALLLHTSQIQLLSKLVRERAKANAVFVHGTLNSVRVFCGEQHDGGYGNFPGPVPLIYCPTNAAVVDMKSVIEAGAVGILLSLSDEEIENVEQLKRCASSTALLDVCNKALEVGLQPIPEITLQQGCEVEMEQLIDGVIDISFGGFEPVAIVVNIAIPLLDDNAPMPAQTMTTATTNTFKERQDGAVMSKQQQRVPILASIGEPAGENRLTQAVRSLQNSSFSGAILRADCLPGYRVNPDLDFVGNFWSAALDDLKSTKSKNFGFRTKVALDKDVPLEWMNYQQSVMKSGALGSPEGSGGGDLDTARGDHKGF